MINAGLTATLNTTPTFRMVKNGELALWSCFAKAGTDSVKLTAFSSLAEALGERNLDIGDALVAVGKISLETWQGKDGEQRYALAIVLTKVEVLAPPSSKPRRAPTAKPKFTPTTDGNFDDALPF